MKFRIIIPARYQSERLPGKPLLDIAGKSMIQRVYEQAKCCQCLDVVIATDDERIKAEADKFGASCVMTSSEHESGTDRLAEVVDILQLADDEVVVNVQGDEPEIPPALIEQVAANLQARPNYSLSTLATPIDTIDMVFDENAVKVVFDNEGKALYFSRASIPWWRGHYSDDVDKQKNIASIAYRHLGIYAYRAGFLREFSRWPVSPLESIERLEQLRALSHGKLIHVDIADQPPPAGIDTQADLERVRKRFDS